MLIMGKMILALVEGLTEHTFVKEVLKPHLFAYEVQIVPTIITTRKNPVGPDYKGGTVKYDKTKKQLLELLRDRKVYVTTMLDFYKLHQTFREYINECMNCYEKVSQIERKLLSDIDHERRFIPYLQLHEFEGLLFSSPDSIACQFKNSLALAKELNNIKTRFRNPEEINDDPITCPSNRLIKLCIPPYEPAFHGPLIARKIKIAVIRSQCPHFDAWLTKLENLPDLERN
jgi:hypothetical protein